uniref:Uncharacterized protein n=1 Tax=Gracilaria firma TaxID=2510791 RepID=A0A1P8D6P0_9FLOR|nr:hypothetical protein [Gracilaria firma]APR74474.1 hypothetical protein [Gracilaria firma]
MFELYLVLITCFLLPTCYLITNSLRYIYDQIKTINKIQKINNKTQLNNKKILSLIKIYINRKKWLDCITMLEASINQIPINKISAEYYNYIGLCYESANMYKIAQRYYLKAYNISPLEKNILKNLANIYKISGDIKNAKKINQRLILLNKNEYTSNY